MTHNPDVASDVAADVAAHVPESGIEMPAGHDDRAPGAPGETATPDDAREHDVDAAQPAPDPAQDAAILSALRDLVIRTPRSLSSEPDRPKSSATPGSAAWRQGQRERKEKNKKRRRR